MRRWNYNEFACYEVRSYDIEYRRDRTRSWLAHVWQPDGMGPFPALIEVHGGAWERFDRMRDTDIIKPLAASGLVVVAIDFHSSVDAPYPAAVTDINYATRWLKAHAKDFNTSAHMVGGLGISSGGHQLMLSAMRPRDLRYNSIPLDAGIHTDANLAYLIAGWVPIDPLTRFLRAEAEGDAELAAATSRYFVDEAGMREANPQLMLERGENLAMPPVLLVQGANDSFITPGVAERFVEHYAAAGGLIEFAKYPGEPHAFMRSPGPNTSHALALMKSFIARRLADQNPEV